jgi:hypothetical protein
MLFLHAEQRHQRQNATLPVIVDAHGEGDVFDRGDEEQRPQHQRQCAQDRGGVRRHVGGAEHRLEGIERTGSDIPEHDAERA